MKIDDAYRHCRAIAHKHGANFSVGFRFLPPVKRRAVYAAYAFCRVADDIADDPGERKNLAVSHPGRRDELLDALTSWFERVSAPLPALPSNESGAKYPPRP